MLLLLVRSIVKKTYNFNWFHYLWFSLIYVAECLAPICITIFAKSFPDAKNIKDKPYLWIQFSYVLLGILSELIIIHIKWLEIDKYNSKSITYFLIFIFGNSVLKYIISVTSDTNDCNEKIKTQPYRVIMLSVSLIVTMLSFIITLLGNSANNSANNSQDNLLLLTFQEFLKCACCMVFVFGGFFWVIWSVCVFTDNKLSEFTKYQLCTTNSLDLYSLLVHITISICVGIYTMKKFNFPLAG